MKSSIAYTIDGKYIREWLILGPFFPDDLETDFLADAGGEANIDPKEGDTVTTADGRTLTWKRYESKEDIVSLLDAVLSSRDREHATAYAFCVLEGQVAGDGLIGLRNNDGIAVWINGEKVYTYPFDRDLSFDSDVFEVRLKAGANRCLVKVSHIWAQWGFAVRVLPPDRAVISGTITDEEGEPIPWVDVRLERDGEKIAQALTNVSGEYRLDIYPAGGSCALSATSGELGDWQLGIQLNEGERRELNLTLKDAISIEGTLLMLDDTTPHVAVPVQALSGEEVIATKLSDERGKYRFTNLKPGSYQVRCQILGGYVYYGEQKAGMPQSQTLSSKPLSLDVETGKALENTDFRFPPFKKGTWRHYTVIDGLASMFVHDIHEDPDGMLWVASCSFDTTAGSGVSRYDGKEFVVFTTKDGLVGNDVLTIHSAPDGVMWFGTLRDGVSRYDGKEFVNFTTEDGLANNNVVAIHRDPDGILWFGTNGGGVSRYDGVEFASFTTEDGLADNDVLAIHRDPDGAIWFGTDGGGVSRYDGRGMGDFPRFVNFTTKDGLVSNAPIVIHRNPDGVMWFGTGYPGGGISRYDGKEFINFTTRDGLVHNRVWDIHRDPDDVLWFATDKGVSRYDGKTFVNFTTADGLLSGQVEAVHRDPGGGLWFGTALGGVSRYDGESFITFTTKDGLPSNIVTAVHRDSHGNLWVGTSGGIARYEGNGTDYRAPTTFASEEGTAPGSASAIHCALDGTVWFATGNPFGTQRGAFRYDSSGGDDSSPSFINFTTADGLGYNEVRAIHSDSHGVIWLGTAGRGISRYDGEEFVNLTTEDGLGSNSVFDIYCQPDGVIWFATWDGVSRYDGEEFVNFTTKDGLISNQVWSIHGDPDGVMWFGTMGGGASRYDGVEFISFTTKDGLASNSIVSICRDPDGVMWFGTWGGGVSGYDGITFTSLDTQDGLADNRILSIESDTDGTLWFATLGGLTRYRRGKTLPRAHITSVTTDQTYRLKTQDSRLETERSSIPAFAVGTRVTIEYNAIDFKTVPEKRQYRCRIYETGDRRSETSDSRFGSQVSSLKSDVPYNPPTKDATFDWVPEKPGTYVFEVQTIDRDLNYSEPASVRLEVIPDPRSNQIAKLQSDLEKRNQELERANAELQRLSEFKSQLLSVVSHELRTPLTSIDGFTRLIRERFLTDDLIAKCNDETRPTVQRVKDRVAIVQENTSRLARLINDLLDFSRIERGRELEMHFSRVELSNVVETVISTYRGPATEKGLTLEYGGEVPLHAGELEVYGDSDRLAQVLSNLVSNSVKFTPEGGAITIGARKKNGKIELKIEDTGVGISKELLPTIFEPFEQAGGVDAKKSGTGLGLAIVKYIIERHDGAVWVESEEGAGSTFTITLSEYARPEASKRRQLQRILIVDDDYDILRLLEEGLSEYPNTHIITANSSGGAFQILEQQSCDVVITDVRLPGDISGLELASQVREKYPGLKVFVMTNTPDEKERVIQTEADWIDKASPNLIHYIAKKIEGTFRDMEEE